MTESTHEHHKNHHEHEPVEHEHHSEGASVAPVVPYSEMTSLKEEILAELQEKKETQSSLSWGGILVTFALGLLAVFSLAQAFQTTLILNKIKSNNFGAAPAAPAGIQNTQNLPNMVGGC